MSESPWHPDRRISIRQHGKSYAASVLRMSYAKRGIFPCRRCSGDGFELYHISRKCPAEFTNPMGEGCAYFVWMTYLKDCWVAIFHAYPDDYWFKGWWREMKRRARVKTDEGRK